MKSLNIQGTGAGASTRPRVVIIGAGFGGLECARGLNGAPADVLLLDRSGFHLFTRCFIRWRPPC